VATRVEVEWALRYGSNGRIAATPNELHGVLASARDAYRATYKVPDWCGVELLRGWAFVLVAMDRAAGGGTLGHEWRSVLEAIRRHPAAKGADLPPPVGVDPDAVDLPAERSAHPKMNGDAAYLGAKLERLREPHVAPINALVDEIRAERGTDQVPYVDPDFGGIAARVLLLFESPSRLGVTQGSGLLSVDNKDETAKNLWDTYRLVELPRSRAVHWNVVPWYLGDERKNSSAEVPQVLQARPYFERLLTLLPDLRVVVAAGAWAQLGVAIWQWLLDERGVPTLAAPHPSPSQWRTTKGRVPAEFAGVLAKARELTER
jgi:hypothetical protein